MYDSNIALEKRRKKPSFAYLFAFISSLAGIKREAFAELELHLQQLRNALLSNVFVSLVGRDILLYVT